MSKSVRVWLLIAVLQTVYLIYFFGQGAIASADASGMEVFPFGWLRWYGDSRTAGADHTSQYLLFFATATWLAWGWYFVKEAPGGDHRVRKSDQD